MWNRDLTRRILVLLVAALVVSAAPVARSVIIRTGDAAPPPGPAASHFALIAGLSGVHLRDGWILTAGHVVQAARNQKKTEVQLDGRRFALDLDSVVPLAVEGERADLALVRISGDPGLPPLEISATSPPVGTRLVLVGNGPLQEAQRRCWNAAGVVAPETSPGVRCGFAWRKTPENVTNGVQWGTNQVANPRAVMPGPGGTRTRVFTTEFRDVDATPREAQAGVGDSGGPVFAEQGDHFVLAGVMLGVAAQSPVAAIFGDRTYVADLSAYREAIANALAGKPRPGTPKRRP